jgi:hypothetical protein
LVLAGAANEFFLRNWQATFRKKEKLSCFKVYPFLKSDFNKKLMDPNRLIIIERLGLFVRKALTAQYKDSSLHGRAARPNGPSVRPQPRVAAFSAPTNAPHDAVESTG